VPEDVPDDDWLDAGIPTEWVSKPSTDHRGLSSAPTRSNGRSRIRKLGDDAETRRRSPPSGRRHRQKSSSNKPCGRRSSPSEPHGQRSSPKRHRSQKSVPSKPRGRKTTEVKKLLASSAAGTSGGGGSDLHSSFRLGHYSPSTNLNPLEWEMM
jgi:hypothetical protein